MTHTIETDVNVQFRLSGAPDDEREVAYPVLRIDYNYAPGRPAYTPRGEYAPIDPPESPEVDFVSVEVIDGDGICLSQSQANELAKDWLYDEGFNAACERAEKDRRHGHDL